MNRYFALATAFLLIGFSFNIQAQDKKPLVFKSTGVAAGGPEAALPRGAIVHIQINNLETTLTTTDKLIMNFVPEKAVPPQLKPFLDRPSPVLALLSTQMFGAAMDLPTVGKLFGLNPAQPISVTFYPGPPQKSFVASFPIADFQAFTGFTHNIVVPTNFSLQKVKGTEVFQINGLNPNLPRKFFVVCSADRAYFTASPAIAVQITNQAAGSKLKDDPFFSKIQKANAGKDVFVQFNIEFVKAMLPQLQKYANPPAEMIDGLKQEFLMNMSPQELARLNMRLRFRFGIQDVHEVLNYVECIAVSGYEEMFKTLFQAVSHFEGITVAFDLGDTLQRFDTTVYSRQIKPEEFPQPVPVAEILKAATLIPGETDFLAAEGKNPSDKPVEFLQNWSKSALAKMKLKKLPTEGIASFVDYVIGGKIVPSLNSKVDWKLSTSYSTVQGFAALQSDSLGEYIDKLMEYSKQNDISGAVQIYPKQADGFLETFFAEEAKIKSTNAAKSNAYEKAQTGNDPFFNTVYRFFPDKSSNPVRKLVFENAYVMPYGLFGYSQHELINRKILWYKNEGEYLITQEGSNNKQIQGVKAGGGTIPAAWNKLLTEAPKNANTLSLHRGLHRFLEILKLLDRIETTARKELDAFLAKAEKDLAKGEAGLKKLEESPTPIHLMAVKKDLKTGKLYALLPGGLRYPRPKFMPKLTELTKLYAAKADQIGGGAVFTSVEAGKYSVSAIQSTEALSYLIKSVGNAFFEKYGGNGHPGKKFARSLIQPGDGEKVITDNLILYNQFWDFLIQEEAPDFGGMDADF